MCCCPYGGDDVAPGHGGYTMMRRAITLLALCTAGALAPGAPAAATPIPATAIALERAGGFAGLQDSFVVDRSTVGGQRARRIASSTGFRRLRSSYQPANACCDRYSYRLTVTYRGGNHKTISAVQGTTAPPVLWQVIAEVERVGTRSPR